MSKVYIVCEPTRSVAGERVRAIDLTPAADWGEPIILLQNTQVMFDTTDTMNRLRDRLKDFSDDDYLVPIGDPVLMCAAASVAAFRNNGRVKMLKWDRKLSKYYPVQMEVI